MSAATGRKSWERDMMKWIAENPVPLESSPTESVSAAINAIVALNSPHTDSISVARERYHEECEEWEREKLAELDEIVK